MMPMGPAPVTRTSSPSTGNASAVWTALPERVEDRGDLMRHAVAMDPDVGHRQNDIFGEGAVAV